MAIFVSTNIICSQKTSILSNSTIRLKIVFLTHHGTFESKVLTIKCDFKAQKISEVPMGVN